jgi:hypothetical protein
VTDHSGDLTPPRTPASLQRLAAWGIVEAWLAQGDQRGVVFTGGPKGLRLTVIDSFQGEEVVEDISLAEDPSRAVLRAVERLQSGAK